MRVNELVAVLDPLVLLVTDAEAVPQVEVVADVVALLVEVELGDAALDVVEDDVGVHPLVIVDELVADDEPGALPLAVNDPVPVALVEMLN